MTEKPTVRIECDDLVLTDEETEEVYLDRSGQWVEYLKRPPWGVLKRLARVIKEPELLDQIDEMLCKAIVAWNWIDDNKKPLAQPSPEVFDDLYQDEMVWLLQHTPELGNVPK